jgi:hypothetical protein
MIWKGADGQPIRPYIPAMARFLIVVTFIEGTYTYLSHDGANERCIENHDSME